jgi:hypothetical protein
MCCDGGFVGFFMVVCGGLRWWVCTLQWVSNFFFLLFYVAPNTVKYFSDYFPKCNQTQEKNYFP